MEKGIIAYFVGGLGNQIFQAVAAYIAAKTKGCPCYIPQSDARNNPHYNSINYTQTLFKYLGDKMPFLNDSHELQYYCEVNGYKPHEGFDLSTGYKAWDPITICPGTKLGSYYQYYPPIQAHEADVRTRLLKGLEPYMAKVQGINPTESAFLHIRRGDYMQYSDAFFTLTLQYYYLCVNMVKHSMPFIKRIYVLSDDIDWVKRQPFFKDPFFCLIEEMDELLNLAIMAQCKAGAICANSTFSWWGAFLGAHEHRMPVFIPKQWTRNTSPYERDLFPKEWMQIEYNSSYWSDSYLSTIDFMKTGIIPMTLGGLGNQMFNIAGSYVTHIENNVPLWIPKLLTDENTHNTAHHDYRQSVFKYFGYHLPFSHRDIDLTMTCHKYKYPIHMTQSAYQPWFPSECGERCVMSSYYQFYPALQPHEYELRALFVRGLEEFRTKFTDKYDFKHTAFLHVRRGDYLKFSDIHFIQPIGYYVTATQQLLQKNPLIRKILIFSDDPDWVKQQEPFKMGLFEFVDNPHELETLALMSLCEAGAICGNSTFSWWGAFLGAYGKRNPVLIPRNWINQPCDFLFPPEWIKV